MPFFLKSRVCSWTSQSQTLKRSYYYKDFVVRKPVVGVSDTVIFKPVCSATETSYKNEFSLVASLDMILFNKRIKNALKYGWLTYNMGLDARKFVFGVSEQQRTISSDWSMPLLFVQLIETYLNLQDLKFKFSSLSLKTGLSFVFRATRRQVLLRRDPYNINAPVHEISNNVVCATSKASDQPAHTRSLIRAFACRSNILWVSSYCLNTIWSILA